MGSEIILFDFEDCEIRTQLGDNGEALFCASDVASVLGYANTRDAISVHCKGVVKRDTLTSGGKQTINFIREPDLFRLMSHSKLPEAQKFEKWIYETVLPSINHTGGYIEKKSSEMLLVKKLEIAEMKERRLAAKEERQRRKDEFAEECKRRTWAKDDEKIADKDIAKKAERLRVAANDARKIGREDLVRQLIVKRASVMSGIDFENTKNIPVMSDCSICGTSLYGTSFESKRYYTHEIAADAEVHVNTVAKVARDLGLRDSEHCFSSIIMDRDETERPTVVYDDHARRLILDEIRMIKEEKKLKENKQLKLIKK
jgi:prophage antirepressor-like protein